MTEFDSSRDFYVIGLINMSFCTTSYDGHYYCTHYDRLDIKMRTHLLSKTIISFQWALTVIKERSLWK